MAKSMNQLELWNRSRELSSQLLQAHENNTQFEQLQSDIENFPFSTETEFTAVMDGVESDSRSESITELQTIIYERIKSLVGFNVDETVDNSNVLHSWNNAQSAATDLLEWYDNNITANDTPSTPYTELATTHPNLLPTDENTAITLIRNINEESYYDTHNELTRTLYEANGDFDVKPVDDTAGTQSQSLEIAKSLVEVFADRKQDKSYREIKQSHSDIDSFPSRDESMMVVMNTSADTRGERIEKIGDWVSEWMNDEEYAEELSHSRQRRMGMN